MSTSAGGGAPQELVYTPPVLPLRSALSAVCLCLSWCIGSVAAADAERCLAAHEIAQEQRLRGHYVDARAALLVCVQPECPRLVSRDCATWLGEVEASVSTVVFAVDDSAGHNLIHVRISSDGKVLSEQADGRALPLDPGVRTLRFEAEGYTPAEETVSIRESEKGRMVRVTLSPLAGAAPRNMRTADTHVDHSPRAPVATRHRRLVRSSYALSGLAAAGLGVGVFYALAGKRRYDNLVASCGREDGCSERATDAGALRYVVADVAFGVAGAAAVGALVSYLFARRLHDHGQLTVGVGGDGRSAGMSWRGAF
jgi:hypothetical protein